MADAPQSESSLSTAIDLLDDVNTAQRLRDAELRYAYGLAYTDGAACPSSSYHSTTLPSTISSFYDLSAYYDEEQLALSMDSDRIWAEESSSEQSVYLFVYESLPTGTQ
uniref:Uncharacterized protein n=1 Tax=Steinernema glaseri TaxID=37863 RepID=A0A1I8AS73_9BILA